MSGCRARSRGFTLVEVLIVLVLTSLLTLTLFSAFRTGIKAWRTAEDHLQRVEGAQEIIARLRAEYLQSLAVPSFGP